MYGSSCNSLFLCLILALFYIFLYILASLRQNGKPIHMYRKRKTRRENGTYTRENYCTFSAEIVKSGTIRLTSLLECMFRANSAFSLKGEFVVGFPMHLIKLCPPILMYVVNDCIDVMYECILHSTLVYSRCSCVWD